MVAIGKAGLVLAKWESIENMRDGGMRGIYDDGINYVSGNKKGRICERTFLL